MIGDGEGNKKNHERHERVTFFVLLVSFVVIFYHFHQIENEDPQPQVAVALGLLTKNREPSKPLI